MDPMQQFIEIEAIKRLKARYFRFMDTKDWASWRSVFTDDATLIFDNAVSTGGRDGQPAPTVRGGDAIIAYVSDVFSTCQTVHQGFMPEIDILSETDAKGIWAMEDNLDYGNSQLRAMGHYHETYRKIGGEWKIATVHLTRLRVVTSGRDGVSF